MEVYNETVEISNCYLLTPFVSEASQATLNQMNLNVLTDVLSAHHVKQFPKREMQASQFLQLNKRDSAPAQNSPRNSFCHKRNPQVYREFI